MVVTFANNSHKLFKKYMNDRFKFRGFYNGSIHEVFSFCEEFVKLVINGEVVKVLRNEVELMQCNGLKDKNGNLIFEGDILRCDLINECCEVCDDAFYLVGFQNASFGIHFNYNKKTKEPAYFEAFDIENDFCEYEIVGNKFENKDLIKSV